MKKEFALILLLIYILDGRTQSLLHISGNHINDQSGHQVILRGVNLGGWLVTEDWMCGITDTTDSGGRSARKTLETIYPDSLVKRLVNMWEDHWITSSDIDTIKSLGFNFIRVPFGWRNLQDQNQHWYLDSSGNIDLSRLDWIVDQAAQRNMYVLLDYHIWLNQDLAYNGISGTDSVILSTCAVWKVIAEHFKNSPTVAGYDILNEPTSSAGEYVKQMIYDTIRSVDSSHIISIEWTAIDTSRWRNVLYQDHWYGLSDPTLAGNQAIFDTTYLPILHAADSLNVPYYIGETQVADDSSYAWSLNEYCLNQTNWSPWTYKTINEWGWGMISIYPNNVSVNILTDPYDTILYRWSQISNANNWYELQNVKQIWSDAATCINAPNGIKAENAGPGAVSLFPNPADDAIELVSPNAALGSQYAILNPVGQALYRGEVSAERLSLKIQWLPTGVYFIRISGYIAACVKFIKK